MKFKDYYQILGVEDSASQDEIKRAYRKKARLYHPDVSKESDAEEQFKSVTEAYEVLRDDQRRAEFDHLKTHGFRAGDQFKRPAGWQGDWAFDPGVGNSADFSDFFASIFGQDSGFSSSVDDSRQRSVRGRRSKGDNINLTVRVPVENAYRGGKTRVAVPAGNGYSEKTLTVNIPAGVVDGQLLRLRGQGMPAATNGDLILTIKLNRSDLFTVDGADVSLIVPITPLESLEGTQFKVPTLGGMVKIIIPPKTKSGTRLRLKGKGLPATPAGDQIVVIQIALPHEPGEGVHEKLKEIESYWDFDPRSHFDAINKVE